MTAAETTPKGLGAAGVRLWESVAGDYELEEHEARLLLEASRTADHLDTLAGVLAVEGLLIDSATGPRTHPAMVEARQQRLVLGRLLSALRLPAGDEDEGAQVGARRPQRRSAFRGSYGIRGAVS